MKEHANQFLLTRRDLLTVAMGAALGAAGAPSMADAQKRGGTLRLGHIGDIANLDWTKTLTPNYPIFNQLYNVLLRLDENLKPQPELAESFELSPDALSLTLTLRKAVKFHSGREFDSKDVAFSVEHYKDEKTVANIQHMVRRIKSVDTPDKFTAVLRFEYPCPIIFDALDLLFIADRETVASIKTNAVGTGPFKFVSWDPGNTVTLARYEGYWRRGYPLLDQVIVQAMPDVDAMQIAFESGTLDVIEQPRYEAVARLKTNKNFKLVMGLPGANVIALVMNTTAKPFNDKRVRQAINYAIDRKKVVDQYLAGVGEPWVQPWPATSFAYEKRLADRYSFNLDRAKQLLSEAGYAQGLEFTHLVGPEIGAPGGVKIAQILQADLAKIGVKTRIETGEMASVRPRLVKGDYQLGSWQFGRANKDPGSLFGGSILWSPSVGWHKFKDPRYAELVSEGERTADRAKRKEIYRQLTELVLEESFTVPLAPRLNIMAVQAYVRDFGLNLDAMQLCERCWLDK